MALQFQTKAANMRASVNIAKSIILLLSLLQVTKIMLAFPLHIIHLVAPFHRVKTSPFHLSLIFTQNVAPGLEDHQI